MNTSGGHIVLTGASGYIGRHFLKLALLSNFQVTILSRRPVAFCDKSLTRWFDWSLGKPPPDEAFQTNNTFSAPTAIVHLAHAWYDNDDEQRDNRADDINIFGMKLLIKAAHTHRIQRFIFASSMAAREDAPNFYGRTKWDLEQLLEGLDEVAARIGLVYGGQQAGLWKTLCTIVKMSPLLPMVESGRPSQPIHVDDVSEGLIRLATMEKLNRKVYRLADPVPVPFGRILQLIAKQTFSRSLIIIPISFRLVMKLLDILKYLPFIAEINRERLLGLSGILTSESENDLEDIGLQLRDFSEGLSYEHPQRRRLLLREGRVMLHYLTGEKPSGGAIRRYVRGVIAYGDSRPVRLPLPATIWPPLFRFFAPLPRRETNKQSPHRDTLEDRLSIALKFAETTTAGAVRMYDYRGTSKFGVIIGLAYMLVVEAILFPLRIISDWRYR